MALPALPALINQYFKISFTIFDKRSFPFIHFDSLSLVYFFQIKRQSKTDATASSLAPNQVATAAEAWLAFVKHIFGCHQLASAEQQNNISKFPRVIFYLLILFQSLEIPKCHRDEGKLISAPVHMK